MRRAASLLPRTMGRRPYWAECPTPLPAMPHVHIRINSHSSRLTTCLHVLHVLALGSKLARCIRYLWASFGPLPHAGPPPQSALSPFFTLRCAGQRCVPPLVRAFLGGTMLRERRPPRSLAGAEAPLLLRLIYRVVPKGMADVILPPNASLSRQVCPADTRFLVRFA